MKNSGLLLLSVSLIFSLVSFQPTTAQAKTQEEQETELRIQQAINEQKKAMVDQQKANAEALQRLQSSQDVMEKSLKNIDVQVEVNDNDSADNGSGKARRYSRTYHFEGPGTAAEPFEPFVRSPGGDHFMWHSYEGDNESTSWDFSRTVKDRSLKSEYSFDVEKTAHSVLMSVSGDCKAGEIQVGIIMPDGKTYSDIVIDELGNLNWRKSFTISETENQDKTGAWKFRISSNKATGFFKISLKTF